MCRAPASGRTLTTLYRRGKLGDVVLLASITGALTPCTVVTDRRYHALVRRFPGVGTVTDQPARHQINLQRRTLLGRSIHKRGLQRRLWLHTGWPSPPRPSVPELYAAAAGVSVQPLPWIKLPPANKDTILLIPGAAWAPKRWGRFAALGARLPGRIVVAGSLAEAPLIHAVCESISGAIPLAERGFSGILTELARARAVVAADTGLMHLAGACGVPVVAIFGPTHPDDGFWVYPGEVVQRQLSCRPCALHRVSGCKVGHHGCMAHTVEQVHAALLRVLQ